MADEKFIPDNPHRTAAKSQEAARESIQQEWDKFQTAKREAATKAAAASVEAAKAAVDQAKADAEAAKQALQTAKAEAKKSGDPTT